MRTENVCKHRQSRASAKNKTAGVAEVFPKATNLNHPVSDFASDNICQSLRILGGGLPRLSHQL